MSAPAPSHTPQPRLVGVLTVKIHRCEDLRKSRLLGKMDPYVKIDVGTGEKFKSKVCIDGDKNPVFDQSFAFNLTGAETDIHVRVFDSETLSDAYIGRFDVPIVRLLATGGAPRVEDLLDPENFKKHTGKIEISAKFDGEGAPAATQELAPIAGAFHFQHNATGFIAHTSAVGVGAHLVLKAGGLNSAAHAFEFQGPYIRSVADHGLYLTANGQGVTLQKGISEHAKWKWSGLGLQSLSNSYVLAPMGDSAAAAADTPLHLVATHTPAAGFTLLPSKATAEGSSAAAAGASDAPVQQLSKLQVGGAAGAEGSPHASNTIVIVMSPTNGGAAPAAGGAAPAQAVTPEPGQKTPVAAAAAAPISSPPVAAAPPVVAAPAPAPVVHEPAAAAAVAAPVSPSQVPNSFDLNFPSTWPAHVHIKQHPHELTQLPEVYKGTYNCDVCKLQGQGITYHCQPCGFDAHPACAKKNMKH